MESGTGPNANITTRKPAMKNHTETAVILLQTLLICLTAGSYFLIHHTARWALIPLAVLLFVTANLLPMLSCRRIPSRRLRICGHGVICLKSFLASLPVVILYHIILMACLPTGEWFPTLAWSILVCVTIEAVLFWNGMLCVYGASVQLGIRHRALGILCGCIPILHLFMLVKIIHVVSDEVAFETACIRRDTARHEESICRTRYPLLLVHGTFFRDSTLLNYWGRIPAALTGNGANIFYGNHGSAASVKDSAEELACRIREIVQKTGCEKVNVIAHSKGGLDIRYALAHCKVAPMVASVTTINTPHRGCGFADYLLEKIPQSVQNQVAAAYNGTVKKLGDTSPDFMASVRDLTAYACVRRDAEMKVPHGIFFQSVGSKLNHATGGKFPLNFSYPLVRHFDGANDGLVAETSFQWGENYIFLETAGKRGISHGDMIDLNRENIPGFDVREFYVQLVHDLKIRGL